MKNIRLITAFMLCSTMLFASGCAEKNADGAQVTEETVTYETTTTEEITEKSEITTVSAVVTTESETETQPVTTTTATKQSEAETETTTAISETESTTSTEKQSIEELFADGIEINGKKYAIPMYMEDFGEGYSWSDSKFHPELSYNGKTIATVSLNEDTNEISVFSLNAEYEYRYGEIYAGNSKKNIETAYGKPEEGYEIMGIGSAKYPFGKSYISIMYQDDILLGVEFWLNIVPDKPAIEIPDYKEKSFSIRNDIMTSFHINGVKLPTNINDMPEEIALKGDPIIMTENGRDMAMDMILNDSQLVGNLSYYADSGEITSVSVDSISNNAEVEVYGISMGDNPEKVIEILGEPDEKNEDNIGMYLYMEDNMSTLMITFIDNKVAMIMAVLAE